MAEGIKRARWQRRVIRNKLGALVGPNVTIRTEKGRVPNLTLMEMEISGQEKDFCLKGGANYLLPDNHVKYVNLEKREINVTAEYSLGAHKIER